MSKIVRITGRSRDITIKKLEEIQRQLIEASVSDSPVLLDASLLMRMTKELLRRREEDILIFTEVADMDLGLTLLKVEEFELELADVALWEEPELQSELPKAPSRHVRYSTKKHLLSNTAIRLFYAIAFVTFCLCMLLLMVGCSHVVANNKMDLPIGPAKFGDVVPVVGQVPGIAIDEPSPRDVDPPIFYGETLDTRDDSIIYVIDCSGSMSEPTSNPYIDLNGRIITNGTRWERALIELKRSVQGLSENFTFNIVYYHSEYYRWSPKRRDASTSNKAKSLAWISKELPQQFTATGNAVAFALTDKSNLTLVLLTDGSPNAQSFRAVVWGLSGYNHPLLPIGGTYVEPRGHRRQIRIANTQKAKIHVIAISPSAQARTFCQGVALDSGGIYYEKN